MTIILIQQILFPNICELNKVLLNLEVQESLLLIVAHGLNFFNNTVKIKH